MGGDPLMLEVGRFWLSNRGESIVFEPERHVVIPVNKSKRDYFQQKAVERRQTKRGAKHSERMNPSDPYAEDRLGIIGEYTFGAHIGQPLNEEQLKCGDGGVDFVIGGKTVEFKIYRNPHRLLLKEDAAKNIDCAKLHILGGIGRNEENIILLGWEKLSVVKDAPTEWITSKAGKFLNHVIHRDQLRSMIELQEVIR